MISKSKLRYITYDQYKEHIRDKAYKIEEIKHDGMCFTLLKMKGYNYTSIADSQRYPPTVLGLADNIDEAREWCLKQHRKPKVEF